jgi:hypothetical protein
MESTGVYWIPLYQILEARGFQVFLVNAQHVKNVPGRKSDVSDCQWIQYLHSVGLLKASFRVSHYHAQFTLAYNRKVFQHHPRLSGQWQMIGSLSHILIASKT